MSKRKPVAAAATIITAAVLAAPAPSQAAVDVTSTCTAVVGDRSGTVDLSPVVRVGFNTCAAADLRD